MTVTLTVKQVPEPLAGALKQRAARNKRSLQKELLLIMEHAAAEGARLAPAPWPGVAEPLRARYATATGNAKGKKQGKVQAVPGKLSLQQLWQRARKLGATMPDESTDIVRKDRDANRR